LRDVSIVCRRQRSPLKTPECVAFVAGLVEIESDLRSISNESQFLQTKQLEINATISNVRQNILAVLDNPACSASSECLQARADVDSLGMATDFTQVMKPTARFAPCVRVC
jgi:hypothetical protein